MVGIIMGSDSDLPIMQEAIDILEGFDITVAVDIVSAHRTPEKLFEYANNAHKRDIKVIVAGAGGVFILIIDKIDKEMFCRGIIHISINTTISI